MRRLLAAAFLLTVVTSTRLSAQTTSDIEVARAQLATERKSIVAQNLPMSEQESTAFWPVYENYRSAMREVGDRRVKLIKDYAAAYQNLTDDQAKKMLRESQDIAKKELDVKEDYVGKFSKVLPAKKVARFYQIESKLDATVAYGLAHDIPLAK
jgi:hypothetical protein